MYSTVDLSVFIRESGHSDENTEILNQKLVTLALLYSWFLSNRFLSLTHAVSSIRSTQRSIVWEKSYLQFKPQCISLSLWFGNIFFRPILRKLKLTYFFLLWSVLSLLLFFWKLVSSSSCNMGTTSLLGVIKNVVE